MDEKIEVLDGVHINPFEIPHYSLTFERTPQDTTALGFTHTEALVLLVRSDNLFARRAGKALENIKDDLDYEEYVRNHNGLLLRKVSGAISSIIPQLKNFEDIPPTHANLGFYVDNFHSVEPVEDQTGIYMRLLFNMGILAASIIPGEFTPSLSAWTANFHYYLGQKAIPVFKQHLDIRD